MSVIRVEIEGAASRAEAIRREADEPHSDLVRFGPDKPLRLDAGVDLSPFQIAYKTYGALNAERSNAILVCHALTGDQYLIGEHPATGKAGWWETMVGPGKPIDTERFFVICPNVLGGCMGTTGPASKTTSGEPYGLSLPVVTIGDMVRSQAMLLDHLGIDSVLCVTGGSMGGMQALQWAASLSRARVRGPADRLRRAPLGAEHRLSRGRPPGGDGRSRLAQRSLSHRGHEPAPRARGRAHGRAHHLSFGRGAAPQVRPRAAGPQGADLRLRRRLPGGELSAPSRLDLRRALRCQQLSLHHARDGLFRSRRRLRRRARQRLPRRQDAFLHRLLHLRLAVPDERRAPDRARA